MPLTMCHPKRIAQASKSSARAAVRPCGRVCTSLVAHHVGHPLLSSLETCLFKQFARVYIGPLGFLLWNYMFSICFAYWALIRYMIWNYFLHSVGFLVSSEAQKLSIFMKSSLFVLLLLEPLGPYLRTVA